jgi:hypothetical protein
MSHAYGAVRFPDGKIMSFEYNGTADVCHPKLHETQADVTLHWREKNPWKICTCGNQPEKVEAYNDYGDGSTWTTIACKQCAVIINCSDPLEMPDHKYPNKPDWINLIP